MTIRDRLASRVVIMGTLFLLGGSLPEDVTVNPELSPQTASIAKERLHALDFVTTKLISLQPQISTAASQLAIRRKKANILQEEQNELREKIERSSPTEEEASEIVMRIFSIDSRLSSLESEIAIFEQYLKLCKILRELRSAMEFLKDDNRVRQAIFCADALQLAEAAGLENGISSEGKKQTDTTIDKNLLLPIPAGCNPFL